MWNEKISETSIAQGDLVLIINNKRPTKSGFWRKIRDGASRDKVVYYVLEKPLHKDYDIKDEKLSFTHIEKDCFVMKDTNLRYDQILKEDNKYNILLDIRGVDAIQLVKNNYDLNSIDLGSKNVAYTSDFEDFIKYYNNRNKKQNNLEEIAKSFI